MASEPETTTTDSAIGRFRRWFWRPPRAHGEIIEDRTVGFLELFYDLVYVVVIAQAAHHLADHVTGRGVLEFAIIFGLIWIAWLNGTLYVDLHGREDGRTRALVFIQMALLALLAAFTGGAGSETGTEFALVYLAFMLLLSWMWWTVRRQDDPRFDAITGRYLVGMIVTSIAIAVSAFLPDDLRLTIWAAVSLSWVFGTLAAGYLTRDRGTQAIDLGATPTDSLVERFGLFTIIVLGEVVVGVVDGMGEATLDLVTMATGLFALIIGFGLWWVFFDFVGRRLPRSEVSVFSRWMMSHLPITLAIAAAGASMVGLIHHAHDGATDEATAWLLSGSVAVVLLSLIVTVRTLVDYERLVSVYRPITLAMGLGALAAFVVGWLRPTPWLLALLLVVILSFVWVVAVDRWLRVREEVLAAERAAAAGDPVD